jgi:hypothetical protein
MADSVIEPVPQDLEISEDAEYDFEDKVGVEKDLSVSTVLLPEESTGCSPDCNRDNRTLAINVSINTIKMFHALPCRHASIPHKVAVQKQQDSQWHPCIMQGLH